MLSKRSIYWNIITEWDISDFAAIMPCTRYRGMSIFSLFSDRRVSPRPDIRPTPFITPHGPPYGSHQGTRIPCFRRYNAMINMGDGGPAKTRTCGRSYDAACGVRWSRTVCVFSGSCRILTNRDCIQNTALDHV